MVRRFLLFLVMLQVATGNRVGAECLKLPLLAQHYRMYDGAARNGSLLEFLQLHYTNTSHRKADPAHRQLPLQTMTAGVTMTVIFPPAAPLFFVAGSDTRRQKMPMADDPLPAGDFSRRLLRPPRF